MPSAMIDARTFSSAEKLHNFLESTQLHKKEFAELIGVTLSYVYTLLDPALPFSSRPSTLSRIATVMGCSVNDFVEAPSHHSPLTLSDGMLFLMRQQAQQNLSNLDVFQLFPVSERFTLVELWRGAKPLPIDWAFLEAIGKNLGLSPNDLFPYWQQRVQDMFIQHGLDPHQNKRILTGLFSGAQAACLNHQTALPQ